MRFKSIILVALTALVLWAVGCSGGSVDLPVLPDVNGNVQQASVNHGTSFCMGLWNVIVDTDKGTIEASQLRASDLALNVLSFMEPPPFSSLNIDFKTLELNPVANYIGVDVILKHPINDPTFMGFDVRGIVFGPRLMNADGLTEFMNPDAFSGVPFGYQNGLLGAPDKFANYSDEWNGYKYFCDGLGKDEDLGNFFSDLGHLDNRGVFMNGATNTRHYDLSWEGKPYPINFLVFNYAVYANYNWPGGEAPVNIDDFDITTANSAEPFCASITEINNALYNQGGVGGGGITLDVEIWDWQGTDSLEVSIEAPGAIPSTPATSSEPSAIPSDKVRMYHFEDIPGTPEAMGDLDVFIVATDPDVTFGQAWFMGLMNTTHSLYNVPVYTVFRHSTVVDDCPKPYILGIDPHRAIGGYVNPSNYDDAEISGNHFSAGPELVVKLTRDGATDITCSDVKVVSPSLLTCDISFSGAINGWWDLEITNGCGAVSVKPNALEVVDPADPVGNIALEVIRWDPPGEANYAIDFSDNVLISWDAVPGAEEYVVYSDSNPYDGFTFSTLEGTTSSTKFYDTLGSDGAAAYMVRARSVAGYSNSQSTDSEMAFVDIEQAESLASVGSWGGNSFYDNINLYTDRSDTSQHNSGVYGWYDSMGPGTSYRDSYEVFHSDAIPEIADSETYRLEVVWDVDYFYHASTANEDGFSLGWLNSDTIPHGYSTATYPDFRIAPLIDGPAYSTYVDGITDEFPGSNLSGVAVGSGYTGGDDTRDWQLSVGDVSAIADDLLDYVCVVHATDNWYAGSAPSRYYRVDDIAIVIY